VKFWPENNRNGDAAARWRNPASSQPALAGSLFIGNDDSALRFPYSGRLFGGIHSGRHGGEVEHVLAHEAGLQLAEDGGWQKIAFCHSHNAVRKNEAL